MNTRAVIITIIVSFFLLVLGPLTLIAQTIPLDQAVQQGKVQVEITGLGGSTGDTILLNVQRKVPERLTQIMRESKIGHLSSEYSNDIAYVDTILL